MALGAVCGRCLSLLLSPRSEEARRFEWRHGQRGRARAGLMAELGMPAEALWWTNRLAYHGGERDGFELEMFGMEPARRAWPPPWPYVALRPEGMPGAMGILKQIWLRRVRCPGTPLIVEARWHPEREEAIAIRGLERATRDAELKLALDGMRLLRRLDHRGRPPGRTTLGRDEFLRLYRRAREECLADGFPPTDNNLLRYLPISKATLVRYRNKWLASPPE